MNTFFVGFWIAASMFAPVPLAWSGQEAVNGFYDAQNDWFVFEWIEEDHGKLRGILDPSNKVKPSIRSSVSLEASSGTYTYGFQVTNLPGAVQVLQHIYISHPSPVSHATSPAPQEEWFSGEYRNQGIWGWAKIKGTPQGIPAGQTTSGFSFKSKGLPGIVDAEFAGKRRKRFSSPGDDASPEVVASFEKVYANLKAQYPDKYGKVVKLKTIGPVDPPATFDAAAFIQKLIELNQQSAAQGWTKNKGIEQSLAAKLETAKKKIESGDNKTAKNTLGAFLNEVSAQNGKHLTAEAYALLFFNAKYLADKL